jgi:NAD(P)-dependent dehydrogenase (short-subunit alcohol dehydrogenase family)
MSQLFQTPFGRHSTASEVIDGVDLSGKRAIVTGAGSGIGTETARALASAGAEVVLAVRRPQAAGQIAAGIAGSTGSAKVSVRALDLADQDSVRRFAAAWDQPLHILVNNAGIMALPELERTREGWEMQFATNFLGHFALTTGLHDALAAAHGARIVSVSSSGHLLSPVVFETCTSTSASTTPSPPTASPRPPTRCWLLRPRAAGPAKASTPTPSTPAPSPPACNSTPAA